MSSIPKGLPYKIDSEYNIINVLQQRHEIPFHSRPFSWDQKKDGYIGVVVRDAINAWRKNELHWLGFIIIYSEADIPAISDAQHRLTVCFLMIAILSELLTDSEALTWISKYGSKSIRATAVPPEDQEILDKHGWTRYPNIESRYENDFEALGNILNGKVEESTSEEITLLHKAYGTVKEFLTSNLSNQDEYKAFLNFIYDNVKVTRMVITDWEFTIRIFNSINNIKLQVPASILLKNVLATAMGGGDAVSKHIHTVFETWKKEKGKGYEKFMHSMVNLLTRRIVVFKDYERRITDIMSFLDPDVCPLTALCKVVDRATEAEERLNSTSIKQLFDMVNSNHEATTHCLLPIAYIAGTEHFADVIRLIRAMISFVIRYSKPQWFNSMTYLTYLRGDDKTPGIINELLQEKLTVKATVDTLIHQMREWLGDEDKDNRIVTARIASEQYTHNAFKKTARCILLFKAELTDSHEARLDYSTIHIDHIYPKKPSAACPPLTNPSVKNCLGNLTPFVGKNSGTVKGNSALGNKSFDVKVLEYRKSNIAMTRAVAERYGSIGFTDAQIEERSHELAAEIAILTAAELRIT
jgi:hypothetical protein